jgi:cell division protein FtsB
MIEDIILALQILILILILASLWNVKRANKSTERATALIEQYRREIGWLTERMEMLEARVPGAIKFK